MNNNIIIVFLVLLSLFISTFLTNSFSNNQRNSLDIVKTNDTGDVVIDSNEYIVIKSDKKHSDFIIKDELKIYYVGSYGPGHVCGQPQINSFFKKIQHIGKDFGLKVDIEGWYLDTGKLITNKTQITSLTNHVIKDIKRYDPDIIYVTDDAAFEYIGISLSKKYPILFSGLNNSYESYEFKYNGVINNSNISGIDEVVSIEKLYNLFKSASIFPDKWYFINDSTDVSKYIFNNLRDELHKIGVDYEVFNVNDTKEFIDIIKDLNNQKPGVIVNNTHFLYSSDYKIQLDVTSLTMLLISYNKVHLEFSLNDNLCNFGLSISCGPDYNKMGYIIGEMFINMLEKGKKRHNIIRLKDNITINYKRIEDLLYYRGLLNHLDKVDNIISSY